MNSPRHESWMTHALIACGVLNLVGGLVLGFGQARLFAAAGIPAPNHVELVQLIGLAVGLLGVGLLIAANDPFRHWPVIFLGMTGKLASFSGLVAGVVSGRYPLVSLVPGAALDLFWVPIFGAILVGAYKATLQTRRSLSPEIVRMALRSKTQFGVSLDEISRLSPAMIVFLRHAGCTFCREALADLAKKRPEIERNGTRLVLVHMGSEEHGQSFFGKYGLADVPRVSDPGRTLYRAFGLPRGSFGNLFGPKVWWRGFEAGILGRHGVGRLVGDGFQMPGVFVVFHGEVIRTYRHQSAGDRPDYLALVPSENSITK
jgi:peroxiredoxin